MTYKKLPPVNDEKYLEVPHFPNRFYAAVFRLWETVPAERIAKALETSVEVINKAASDMGLPQQKFTEKWAKLGYITTLRNSWHILPYDQLLVLLDWDEDMLATRLKEDDFLDIKFGRFKPKCDKVVFEQLDDCQKKQLSEIKKIMESNFSNMFCGCEPFSFFDGSKSDYKFNKSDNLRMIYSYCGLYETVLDNDIDISFPDSLLEKYSSVGINAVWLPVVLYKIVPFPFDESYSKGWQKKIENLKKLIKKAAKYDLNVYLYLNEPRCMPNLFFENHPELMGKTVDKNSALCTSVPAVMDYLRYAVRTLCEYVPDIGGFFCITASENLTHCKSQRQGTVCERCKDVPEYKLISQVVSAISEESRKVNPDIRTIAWAWAWDTIMSKEDIKRCIDLIPKEVIIQCHSENQKEYVIGGVKGSVADYSMSIPGPAPLSEYIWNYAKSNGHEVSAKVQVNCTWECSTLPFLPVFDLIREHMTGLKKVDVDHIMLSWTLGGYPSINLLIAASCLEDSSEEKYDLLLKQEYGEYAEVVKKAATQFSKAFREFPFHIKGVYRGPQNPGPSNLLYEKSSGFEATMTCFSYDDLDGWRSIYPADIYVNQYKKLRDGWKKGLEIIENMPDCLFKQVSLGGYALFNSCYLQSEYIYNRENGDKKYLSELVSEEEKMALLMYELMQKSSLFGFEASNHYYYNKGMLAEKVINCEYLKNRFSK